MPSSQHTRTGACDAARSRSTEKSRVAGRQRCRRDGRARAGQRGHAHLYQRFTRQVKGRQIPYVVAGSGGHLLREPRSGLPKAPRQYGNYTLAVDPICELGYLTVTVSLADKPPTITATFNSPAERPTHDRFRLDLETGVVESL
jgi:hypothetical protein